MNTKKQEIWDTCCDPETYDNVCPTCRRCEQCGCICQMKVTEPPPAIYLLLFDEEGFPLDSHNEEVAWCADRINKTDVKYIREDLANEKNELI